jgi:hypothetical protein
LTSDFAVAEQQLQVWLAEQDGVLEENQRLLANARFDIVTCRDVTGAALGMAGIPLADREALLKLLKQAPTFVPSTPMKASAFC